MQFGKQAQMSQRNLLPSPTEHSALMEAAGSPTPLVTSRNHIHHSPQHCYLNIQTLEKLKP